MVRIVVAGAAGRMGTNLVRLIAESADLALAGALERAGHPRLGEDAGAIAGVKRLGVPIVDALRHCPDADVLIDFTTPEASLALAEEASARGMRLVVGTTGFTAAQKARLEALARPVGAVIAANFSLGVNLCLALVEQAAKALDAGYDVEIVEAHHRHKADAPSGTALALGEAAASGRGVALEASAIRSRDGMIGARPRGAIGFAVVRGGGVVGEHRVQFLGAHEIVEIRHEALDRVVFAAGAVHAARWLAAQPAGIYTMRDVLGI